jgi:hypothetical protein
MVSPRRSDGTTCERCRSEPPKPRPNDAPSTAAAASTNGQPWVANTGIVSSNATATHHFKILREAGLTERVVVDGHTHQRLRIDEVDDAMPGLLNSVVAKANRETGST